ncbi:V-type ATP synthase subunit D [Neptunomonas phycophila]|uniref:V-type ATP synthase subunit D n=1 Tax=Neptunomonas phycophila TaxID=1572645 RepID=UPI0026E36770|nr:V-type ATP synthase subunit D [Neptunomonas phycophila]MDO6467854.1 V-type ATP synthase subunit D [Neptunomonas phycophila]
MSRLSLNKSTLNREAGQLVVYQRVVPALDMKRKQLMAARSKARNALATVAQEQSVLEASVIKNFPALDQSTLALGEVVQITELVYGEDNIVGLVLPRLDKVVIEHVDMCRPATPIWSDLLIEVLEQSCRLWLDYQVLRERLQRLDAAVLKATQRLNLFEKVLIPRAQKNIRRIRIAIADNERAAVVRAKIAKQKRRQFVSL